MLPLADPLETRSEVDICIDKALLNVLLISGPLSCRGGGRVARGVAGWCYCAAQAKQAGWVRGMGGGLGSGRTFNDAFDAFDARTQFSY